MKTLVVALMAGVLVGCVPGSSRIPAVDEAMVARSGVAGSELRRGHAVYLSQCGRCHELIPPSEVKTADWHLVLPGMCWNAGISKADEDAVTKYVLAARAR